MIWSVCPNVPNHCIFFLELNCFSDYNASQQNEIYLSWYQVLVHFLPYKFLLPIFVDFFGAYSLFYLFKVGFQKKGWFCFYKKSLKAFSWSLLFYCSKSYYGTFIWWIMWDLGFYKSIHKNMSLVWVHVITDPS